MIVTNDMVQALVTALKAAQTEYRRAVFNLALSEAANVASGVQTLVDVDHIHQARVRVLALEAAVEELTRLSREPDTLSDM